MDNLVIAIGILPGILIGWLWGKSRTKRTSQKQLDALEVEFDEFKATAESQLQTAKDNLEENGTELQRTKDLLSTANEALESAKKEIADLKNELTEKSLNPKKANWMNWVRNSIFNLRTLPNYRRV